MGSANGVMMQRFIGVVAAAMLVSMNGVSAADDIGDGATEVMALLDVSALLLAARGAPPVICALAAQAARNYGWGDWNDAPCTPLATVATVRSGDGGNGQFPAADVDRLLEALASTDGCVRELIDPLIKALRDATPNVRANAAWALGRIDSGRALAPVVALFRNDDAKVREAAVIAAGRIDSTSTMAALMRVLQQDESPAVRRVAAWALGQKGAREAVPVLATALGKEGDARVREMIAWAIGNSEGRSASAALVTALGRDADDNVRETAAWALAEIGDRAAVDALGAAADGDRSSRVRGTASWAIGQLHGNGVKAPSGLLKVLKDESDDSRLKAAWALGQIGDASALNAIRDALTVETSNQVRKGLVRALIKSGGRSEETLTELLTSSDPTVREAAVRGLAGNGSFNPWPWPWPRPRPFP